MSRFNPLALTKHSGPKHTATLIFFHGSGANGPHMLEWVTLMHKAFSFPHIKVMYPTAPLQPYTPAGGQRSNVWFDRADVSRNVPEQLESINKIEREVRKLIEEENSSGIPTNRIVVGGFSMGGALAFYTGYRWLHDVAGVFAFGSFLNVNSKVFEDIKSTSDKLPPLLQIHGDNDDVVDLTWAQDTFQDLKKLGVSGEFHVSERLGHAIDRKGMALIKEFVEKLLPNI